MAEIIITQEKLDLMDESANNLNLTYKLFENKEKYKVEVVKKENKQGIVIKEVCRTSDINSYNEAMTLINILIKNKVTPIAINDILDDLGF